MEEFAETLGEAVPACGTKFHRTDLLNSNREASYRLTSDFLTEYSYSSSGGTHLLVDFDETFWEAVPLCGTNFHRTNLPNSNREASYGLTSDFFTEYSYSSSGGIHISWRILLKLLEKLSPRGGRTSIEQICLIPTGKRVMT